MSLLSFSHLDPIQGFAIFDDVLTFSEHALLWDELLARRWEFVHQKRWIQEFPLRDGNPLWSDTCLSAPVDPAKSCAPFGSTLDALVKAVEDKARTCQNLLGQKGETWDYFQLRPTLYPAGSALSWHRHHPDKTVGAYIYYAHTTWDPAWGGELLIAPPETAALPFAETPATGFEPASEKDSLLEEGFGTYIMPKPNRLVILSTHAQHCIKRVEASAGDHVRLSVQGFFHKEDTARSPHRGPV
ncbi:MAG: proline hydroxylase [Candidatus Puniceispirillum sp.]|nr:proline hydroxylase [Candidatus Puniceispirillum sp.]